LAKFRSLSEPELDALDSDELIAHIRAAHEAGRAAEGERALGVLVFRHYDDVRRRVSIKVPPADVEDVAMEAVASAIASAFDGSSVGEFVNWLNRILGRRIADYHRRTERSPDEVALPDEHQEAEGIWGELAVAPDETGGIEIEELVERAMPENEVHRRVIDLYVFEDLGAEATAERVNGELAGGANPGMTPTNVHKIASRFREALRELLDDRGG
jgi:DNA-directed RNA polymerase specialized sigma24 family protein